MFSLDFGSSYSRPGSRRCPDHPQETGQGSHLRILGNRCLGCSNGIYRLEFIAWWGLCCTVYPRPEIEGSPERKTLVFQCFLAVVRLSAHLMEAMLLDHGTWRVMGMHNYIAGIKHLWCCRRTPLTVSEYPSLVSGLN